MTDIEKKAREYVFAHNSNPNPPYCPEGELNRRLTDAFLAGASYALSNQWHDAEKEKPEDEEYVLIYHHKYGIEPAVWNERFNCWDDAEGDDYMYSAENVIAWLPIPKYEPKGDNQ